MLSQTPSSVPVIGSSTVYTITCNGTAIYCTGIFNDTITISWRLNGKSINSATHTESSGSPFTVSSNGTFTSSLTTMGDISISHAGWYECISSSTNALVSFVSFFGFNVKCKLYFIPLLYCY